MPELTATISPHEIQLALRLFAPFALGAFLTLLITSVNHRRDHIKHVRETVSKAVKEISETGIAFWADDYSDARMVRLQGAVTYMQRTLPYAFESTHMLEDAKDNMNNLFGEIAHVALYVEEDLNKLSHKIDSQRVTELLVLCATAEALSNSIFLQKMTLFTLLTDWLRELKDSMVKLFKRLHNIFFIP